MLLVTVSIVLLTFCSTNFFGEASAAQKASQHKNKHVHWGYEFGQFFINTTVGFADLANVAPITRSCSPAKRILARPLRCGVLTTAHF